MTLHFAPLQGYADNTYRRLHASIYGGADFYYTPFIRIEKGEPRAADMRRLQQAAAEGSALVPQIIFSSAEELDALVQPIAALGHDRIDLNLGCPYPMQTRKGRGAALIANVPALESMAEALQKYPHIKFSVKMRLGMESPDEWQAAMPVLNSLPLTHITMHPRVAKQMYGGDLYPEQFALFMQQSKHPVVYNGDIHTPADIDRIATAYPGLAGIMIGRGMLARPSLMAEWRSGEEWPEERRHTTLLAMHSQMLQEYEATLCGQAQILQKIKPFWEYLEPLINRKAFKAIHKATSLPKYQAAIGPEIFSL